MKKNLHKNDESILYCCWVSHQLNMWQVYDCRRNEMSESLMCKFCINFLDIFLNETDKDILTRNALNLLVSYKREFTFIHFYLKN